MYHHVCGELQKAHLGLTNYISSTKRHANTSILLVLNAVSSSLLNLAQLQLLPHHFSITKLHEPSRLPPRCATRVDCGGEGNPAMIGRHCHCCSWIWKSKERVGNAINGGSGLYACTRPVRKGAVEVYWHRWIWPRYPYSFASTNYILCLSPC